MRVKAAAAAAAAATIATTATTATDTDTATAIITVIVLVPSDTCVVCILCCWSSCVGTYLRNAVKEIHSLSAQHKNANA